MPSPQNREEVLFAAALEMPADKRPALLDAMCVGDPALRHRLETLMDAHQKADKLPPLGAPTVVATIKLDLTDAEDEAVGKTIGRYKVLEKVGEGGCGVVYVAEQTEPIRRRVALKVIKLGMDTKQVVARFEAERQALAMMDHPNIAKVLDAGATETGRPYFVMELVRGIKITEYCDQNKLTTMERLDLFIKVCQAIQHAHQKGIIHRDIKPSNILVTMHDGVPVPKVIDFGIAKATVGQTLTDKTLYTQLQQFIGTPAYMSPEQAEMSGLDIDTRSDIYSLGVLLYELLTGRTPFDAEELASQGLDAMRKTIREEEPVRPSTKVATLRGEELTTTAKRRSSETSKLLHQLKGDLDWIVMKCLEKDRTRRYETANGLAMDIQRHLADEPVVARAPSSAYRFRKLVRRNKVVFGTATAIAFALIAGLAVSTWMFVRELQARERAVEAERTQARLRQDAESARAGEAKERTKAEQRLYASLLDQARATRVARQVGYRDRVFAMLKQAQALNVPHKDLTDLRIEAGACLGDFVGLTPAVFDFPTNTSIKLTRVDPTGHLAAFLLSDDTILLRQLPSGAEVAQFKGQGQAQAFPTTLCFSARGDQLVSVFHPVSGPLNLQTALDAAQIRVWSRAGDEQWGDAETAEMPGAYDCLPATNGLFVSVFNIKPGSGKLVDLKNNAVVTEFEIPTNGKVIPEAALSPDGRIFAVETLEEPNAANSVIDLWDLKTGQKIKRLKPDLGYFATLSFNSDGRCLSCLSRLGVAIYAGDQFQLASKFREYFNAPARPAFASGSTLVALPIFQQGRVRLFDWLRNEDFATLDELHPSYQVAFTPDGSFLLSSGSHHASLYRLDSTPEKLSLPGHVGGVSGIVFSPDGARIASVGKDRTLKIQDAMTGRVVWQSNALPGPGQSVCYSHDGRLLVATDFESSWVGLWDAVTGKLLLELGANVPAETWSAQFSPNGRYLAMATTSSKGISGIQLWTLQRGSSIGTGDGLTAKAAKSLPGRFYNLQFAPDGESLFYDSLNPDGKYIWRFETEAPPRLVTSDIISGGVHVQTGSFSSDGRQLLVCDAKRRVVTLDVATGTEISSFSTIDSQGNRASAAVPSVCLNPDDSKVAMNSPTALGVEIRDSKTGRILYSLPDQNGTVYWLAWSPDSQRLAVSRSNGDIAIWNLKAIQQVLAKIGLNP